MITYQIKIKGIKNEKEANSLAEIIRLTLHNLWLDGKVSGPFACSDGKPNSEDNIPELPELPKLEFISIMPIAPISHN